MRGLALEQRNCGTDAAHALETAVAVSRGLNPTALGAVGHVYARMGNQNGVEKTLRSLDKLPGEVTGCAKAVMQIAIGEIREALRLLQRAVQSREFSLVTLRVDRRLDPLRRHSDFRALVERVGV